MRMVPVRRGVLCRFRHRKNPICKFYNNGYCRKGLDCNFIHDMKLSSSSSSSSSLSASSLAPLPTPLKSEILIPKTDEKWLYEARILYSKDFNHSKIKAFIHYYCYVYKMEPNIASLIISYVINPNFKVKPLDLINKFYSEQTFALCSCSLACEKERRWPQQLLPRFCKGTACKNNYRFNNNTTYLLAHGNSAINLCTTCLPTVGLSSHQFCTNRQTIIMSKLKINSKGELEPDSDLCRDCFQIWYHGLDNVYSFDGEIITCRSDIARRTNILTCNRNFLSSLHIDDSIFVWTAPNGTLSRFTAINGDIKDLPENFDDDREHNLYSVMACFNRLTDCDSSLIIPPDGYEVVPVLSRSLPIKPVDPTYGAEKIRCHFCRKHITSDVDIYRDLCHEGLTALCKGNGHNIHLCTPCFDSKYKDLEDDDQLWFK